MSTRRPNVPRTGPASEPRPSTSAVDGRADGSTPQPGKPRSGHTGSTAAHPPRPVTSALPVTRTSPGRSAGSGSGTAHRSGSGSTAAHPRGGNRFLRGLRGGAGTDGNQTGQDGSSKDHSGAERPSGGRSGEGRPGRGRKDASATSTTPTRYTVRREDGRVNYAFTDGGARPVSAGSTAVRPVPAKAFSGRLLALALVLVTITILLAPTVRTYLAQRAEISSLQQSISEEQAQQTQLKDQLARWNDPAYVKQQARDRLFYVMPGETGYLVIGAGNTDEVPPVATSAESDSGPQPWLDALWTSVQGSAAR